MMGKRKWIIIAIIAVIIIAIAVIFIINEMRYHYEIEEIKQYHYFVLSQDGKYGVIDKSGNIVIEPTYEAVQIPNPSKPVFICIRSYNQENKEYDTVVYDDQNQELLVNYSNVQAIPINTNIETIPYEKSVVTYKKDGKYGLVSLEGKEITKPIYDEITSMNYKEGTFLVKQEEKAGVINMKGTVIIDNEYETIASDNYYNETTKNKTTGFIVSKKTQEGYRYGYIDYRGRTILEPEYTELERVNEVNSQKDLYFIAFKDGQAGLLKNKKIILNYEYEDISYNSLNDIFIVQRNGKKGVVNKEGNIILHPEYDNILFGGMYLNTEKQNETFIFDLQGNQVETDKVSLTATDNENYYIAIDENDIYTVVDQNGNTLIDRDYSYIEYLPGNYFIVARDGKNGVIDSTGKLVIDLKYTSIFRLNDTNILQAEIAEDKTIELYNFNMQKIASMDQAIVREYEPSDSISQKCIMLASSDDFLYFDMSGNSLEAKDIFKNSQLFAKKINEKWGFVDYDGNLRIQNEYDMVTDFNEYGFAGINQDGKWGIINAQGIVVQEPIYELDWIQPSFLGTYYRINAWYGDARYSNDVISEEES